MADETLLARTVVTTIGEESTFGTTPASTFPNVMSRVYPLGTEIAIEPTQAALDVEDERSSRNAAIDPVIGLQLETPVKFSVNLKAVGNPVTDQLILGVTPADLPPRILLRHHYGLETANEGGQVASAAYAQVFTVGATEGAHFKPGTWIAVEIAGEMELTKILHISTDTLTCEFALSATPQAGAIVRNLYNYCRKEVHTKSFTVQQAYANSTVAQMTVNGVHGNVGFEFPEYGELPKMTFEGQGVKWTGPSAQSLDNTAEDDRMGRPGVWRPSIYLAQAPVRATRLVCEGGISVDSANQWELIRDGGGVETVNSVLNTAGRPRGPVITLQTRHNVDWQTGFANRSTYQMIIIHKIGTGLTASFWIWEYPVVRLVAPPKPVKVGERLYMELMLHGTQDNKVTPTTETGDDLDRITAVERVAFG